MTTTLQIRPATPDDAELIVRFVRELAVYEKAEHEVLATPEHVKRTLFADNPAVFGLICLHGDQPVGFAVYFFNYSTWQGRDRKSTSELQSPCNLVCRLLLEKKK